MSKITPQEWWKIAWFRLNAITEMSRLMKVAKRCKYEAIGGICLGIITIIGSVLFICGVIPYWCAFVSFGAAVYGLWWQLQVQKELKLLTRQMIAINFMAQARGHGHLGPVPAELFPSQPNPWKLEFVQGQTPDQDKYIEIEVA